jgi:hypothetical protein
MVPLVAAGVVTQRALPVATSSNAMLRVVALVASAKAMRLPSSRLTASTSAGTLPERSWIVASTVDGAPLSGTATRLPSCWRTTVTSSVGSVGFQLETCGSSKAASKSTKGRTVGVDVTGGCDTVGDETDASGAEHAEPARTRIRIQVSTRAIATRLVRMVNSSVSFAGLTRGRRGHRHLTPYQFVRHRRWQLA